MDHKVSDQEYLFIKCLECLKEVKLAKNKGADWKEFHFLEEFLLEHSECAVWNIKIHFIK